MDGFSTKSSLAWDEIGDYRTQFVLSKKEGRSIYQSVHSQTQQIVAIKVLEAPLVADPLHQQSFLREAHILSQLSHPHIVKLYQHGQWAHGLYMVMEYVKGLSLRQYIATHFIPLPTAIAMIKQIAQALEYLHSRGILHGDLKPENIIVTADQQIKLIDFGLARSLAKSKTSTQNQGTPTYFSPEQRQGDPLTESSEVYSLGLIAYELISGNFALGKVVLSLVPDKISKILAKALQPSCHERYPSMQALLADLYHYCMHGDEQKDLRLKDHTAQLHEQLEQQKVWLAPKHIQAPDFLSISLYEHGYSPCPYVYYETFWCGDNFRLWFAHSLLGNATFALTMIKSFLSQWGHEENERCVIRKIHDTLVRLHVPMDEQGISLVCVTIPKETAELSWITCGKTNLWLKKQRKDPQSFDTSMKGLGKISSLQILGTKVAWEIGDEAILCTLQADGPMSSLCQSSFIELKDRRQIAIFCPIESVQYGTLGILDKSPCPSTLMSLKRIR